MIEMRPPRIVRIAALSFGKLARSTTAPSPRGSANRISPRVISPLRGRMRMIDWLTTDLPEPDSPTNATVERGRTRNDAPVTARMKPPGAAKRTCRSRIVNRSVTPCLQPRRICGATPGDPIPSASRLAAVAVLSSSPRVSAARAARSTSLGKPSIRLSRRIRAAPARNSSCIHPSRRSRRVE